MHAIQILHSNWWGWWVSQASIPQNGSNVLSPFILLGSGRTVRSRANGNLERKKHPPWIMLGIRPPLFDQDFENLDVQNVYFQYFHFFENGWYLCFLQNHPKWSLFSKILKFFNFLFKKRALVSTISLFQKIENLCLPWMPGIKHRNKLKRISN